MSVKRFISSKAVLAAVVLSLSLAESVAAQSNLPLINDNLPLITELQERGDVYYDPATNAPYTGLVNPSDCRECGWRGEAEMKDGKLHGKYKEIHEEGGSEGNYKNGKRDGVWKYYRFDEGTGKRTEDMKTFKDGVQFSKSLDTLISYPRYRQGAYTIPNGVKVIWGNAFVNCTGLTSVTIPNSVTDIGNRAFEDCSGLTSITIPDGVTDIGDWAFRGCTGLTSVTIGSGLTSIENLSLPTLRNLTAINVAEGSAGFSSADGVLFNKAGDTLLLYPAAKQGAYVIPDGVTSIGYMAFPACTTLTSITIPNSVTTIEDMAFSGCDKLTSITIPNSVTTIGFGAFTECANLESITIGNNVSSIGGGTFHGCRGLTYLTVLNPTPPTPASPSQGPSVEEALRVQQRFQAAMTAVMKAEEQKAKMSKADIAAARDEYKAAGAEYKAVLVQAPQRVQMQAQAQGMGFFGGVSRNACLHVPANSVSAYRSAEIWKVFQCVEPILSPAEPEQQRIEETRVVEPVRSHKEQNTVREPNYVQEPTKRKGGGTPWWVYVICAAVIVIAYVSSSGE